MSAARDRAEAVLTDVLTTSARDLLRYLESRLGADDAQDALGGVLATAWRRADDLPDDGHDARLWLFGIARNTVLNVRRSQQRRLGLAQHVARRTLAAPAAGADRGLEVRDAIDRLDPELAELVRTVHWDGFTVAEAARILGVPPSTATSRYQRAKRLLRQALDPGDSPPHATPTDVGRGVVSTDARTSLAQPPRAAQGRSALGSVARPAPVASHTVEA
ncbi:MAG: RNA polymerase sigma factor [Cellulomonadaceae bacterium]